MGFQEKKKKKVTNLKKIYSIGAFKITLIIKD